MMIDLAETTTSRIHDAIRQARQRLGGPASGMVLTLVIVTDEAAQYDAVRAASEAAREHPMRVLAVITRRPEAGSRLDAVVSLTGSPAWLTDHVLGDHHTFGTSSPAAVAGYPAITVPAARVSGLPVGISLAGPAWSEQRLIALAHAFELAGQPGHGPAGTRG